MTKNYESSSSLALSQNYGSTSENCLGPFVRDWSNVQTVDHGQVIKKPGIDRYKETCSFFASFFEDESLFLFLQPKRFSKKT